jgi:hypothetical protein
MLTVSVLAAHYNTHKTAFPELRLVLFTMSLRTPVTELFGIKHPVMLAGMNVAAGESRPSRRTGWTFRR